MYFTSTFVYRVLIGEPVEDINIEADGNEEHDFNMENIFDGEREEEEEQESGDEQGDYEDEMDEREDADDPLYFGATITVKQSMLLLLTLMLKHNLNMTCMSDIITMIELHCPDVNLKKNSLYKFNQFFKIGKANNVKQHFYCPRCYRDLENNNEVCPSCPQTKSSYFIQVPVSKQLQEMYSRRNFYDKLQGRFNRQNRDNNSICDVYDGTLYKQWLNDGFLRCPNKYGRYTSIQVLKNKCMAAIGDN